MERSNLSCLAVAMLAAALTLISAGAAAAQLAAPGDTAGAVRIVRLTDSLDWRAAASAAAFAAVHGNPAAEGPFTFWMRMPAEWQMQPHSHNTVENLTVLSGTLYMKFSPTGESVELPAGSAVVIPAGRPMWAWTENETVIQVHGVGPFITRAVAGTPQPNKGP